MIPIKPGAAAPCPNCDSDDLNAIHHDGPRMQIRCGFCGMTGPSMDVVARRRITNEEAAIENWNRMAGLIKPGLSVVPKSQGGKS